jgi:hypothetical protein
VEGRDYYWWTAAASPDSRADEVTVWLREVIRKLHTHTHTGTHRKWGGFETDKRWEGERENFSAENLQEDRKSGHLTCW